VFRALAPRYCYTAQHASACVLLTLPRLLLQCFLCNCHLFQQLLKQWEAPYSKESAAAVGCADLRIPLQSEFVPTDFTLRGDEQPLTIEQVLATTYKYQYLSIQLVVPLAMPHFHHHFHCCCCHWCHLNCYQQCFYECNPCDYTHEHSGCSGHSILLLLLQLLLLISVFKI
jgi:hypothetical protein